MAQSLGYDDLFERSFYSCELGFVKPDTRYFDAIVDALPFAPHEMLFIDDRETNVAAARTVGLRAAEFVHTRNSQAVQALIRLLRRFSIHPSY
jgi:putative hydrolase of the HAD superfamily